MRAMLENISAELERFLFEFAEEFGVVAEDTEDVLARLYHRNNSPLDSVDRVFGLYLFDLHKDEVDVATCLEDFSQEIQDDFAIITDVAYDNYEREGMSPDTAMKGILSVIKEKDRAGILRDCYCMGGWFGSS